MAGFRLAWHLAIKIKFPRVKGSKASPKSLLVRAAFAAFAIIFLGFFGVFSFYYIKYQKIVDDKMSGQIFENMAKIYAQPRSVRVGQKANVNEISNYLRHAGYTEAGEHGESRLGTYKLVSGGVQV